MRREYRQAGEIVAIHDDEECTLTLESEREVVEIPTELVVACVVGNALLIDADTMEPEVERNGIMVVLDDGTAVGLILDTLVECEDLAERLAS